MITFNFNQIHLLCFFILDVFLGFFLIKLNIFLNS